jgi:hypothetical protein
MRGARTVSWLSALEPEFKFFRETYALRPDERRVPNSAAKLCGAAPTCASS